MTGIIAQNVGRTSGLIKSAGGGGGVWTKIKTLTASSDSTLSFVDGSDDVTLDSTYPIYVFKFINIHPATTQPFLFQASTDGGSTYATTVTSTAFRAYHKEDDSATTLSYDTGSDLAESTSFQDLHGNLTSTGNDQGGCGSLHLFNPSSTTYVKHFISKVSGDLDGSFAQVQYIAGYFNTTSAIDAVQFKMNADEIDAGKIKLYGLKDSA
tara:strand:+ start:519 stop:1148 length:630 start_codon:yes stop_codon:yes gene_type:complete